ncbi:nuclear transport factor 2 family protein [Aquirufa lenticrescens]|uniref:nuclear transport factor 2 family protein n=1 Tax=Aquirufa lenticrescens TaxID=2696560 RepID=UPI001CAA6357|nr:nuclear transport factor 2 family protein [Aquirufa lenticrescens]UAJ13526.1 nuclear transport factor 2 family protein [Aquirufa lenticrescens]
MKSFALFLSIMLLTLKSAFAQTNSDETIKQLSKDKWQWMANKDADKLADLFDEKCEFVHMGGTWGKAREVDIIKAGFIWYKQAEVYSTNVKFYRNTAILLSDIDLVAQVGGNVVTNPFMVTEVYVLDNNTWKMAQLTFSHLSRPVKLKQ